MRSEASKNGISTSLTVSFFIVVKNALGPSSRNEVTRASIPVSFFIAVKNELVDSARQRSNEHSRTSVLIRDEKQGFEERH